MSDYEDDRRDDVLTERCRQCGQTLPVDADEPRPDGPWICDSCFRATMRRATKHDVLSDALFELAVSMARAQLLPPKVDACATDGCAGLATSPDLFCVACQFQQLSQTYGKRA